MKKSIIFMLLSMGYVIILNAQPLQRVQNYDITTDRLLYTIGYAHLDTQWNWDYPTTINE